MAWEEEKLEAREMLENSYDGLGGGETRSQRNA
jgi:hypothetical protein